jgi:hypothetical protein
MNILRRQYIPMGNVVTVVQKITAALEGSLPLVQERDPRITEGIVYAVIFARAVRAVTLPVEYNSLVRIRLLPDEKCERHTYDPTLSKAMYIIKNIKYGADDDEVTLFGKGGKDIKVPRSRVVYTLYSVYDPSCAELAGFNPLDPPIAI